MRKTTIGILSACALMCVAGSGAQAQAQSFPTKPIRLILAFAPGGVHDALARLLQPEVSQALGQTVVIENRGGAGGNVAAETVAKSAPDGYTLLFASSALAVNPHMYPSLNYDLFKDLQPVARLVTYPLVFVVPANDPASTVKEFLQAARDVPRPYASPGTGTPNHLAGELLRSVSGAQLLHVPYKGAGPAMTDLMAGRVHAMFLSVSIAQPLVQSGRLKMLGVASKARTPLAPNVPTFAESGFADFEAETYSAVFAPANTPSAIVDRFKDEFAKALASPDIVAKLQELGAQPALLGPAEFSVSLRDESQRWGEIIRKGNITGD